MAQPSEIIAVTVPNWQIGLNTAGRLELHRSTQRKEKGKSLRQYAGEEKKRLKADS
ncbi:hypothetical protein NBRC116598_41810 [Pseudophaeobacter arcticus]|uniref:Uncharacterized protein n=1 Tax=Pseudophaeobacter arcticus TaxID=385492 RepID=A0ABQ0AS84_9RHOB